ncbi:neural-cadherin-like [Antedon mediterranea]|uniref:neural-cadherin-like n=1 Tax=Antedon mediterranea TaxID=105859 RepID=UPI003AF66694
MWNTLQPFGLLFFYLCYLTTVIDCELEHRIDNTRLQYSDFERRYSKLRNTSHRKRRDVALNDVTVDISETVSLGFTAYEFNNTLDNRYVMENYNPRFEVIGNQVVVKEQLDFETSPEEVVDVVYWNKYAPSSSESVQLTFNVLDVNEPPEWMMEYEPYLAVTSQNVVNDVTVYTLYARDPEDPDTEIVYGLFSDKSNMFGVDPVTGNVFIEKQQGSSFVDGEEYVLTVTASEKNNTTREAAADIRVKVGERPPQFTRETYNVVITEEITSLPTNLITVQARSFNTDPVTYSISDQPAGTDHAIDQNGLITLSTTLDREMFSSYTIMVKAVDSIGESICEVHVTDILDINDNGPVFSQLFYAFRDIPENSDSAVGQVTVADEDGEYYGSLLLSLSNGVPFRIDENGTIFPTMQLDYESISMYEFDVTAVDLGGKSATSQVQVDLMNVNDNSPTFSQSNYTFDVDDTVTSGYKINTIYASDKDGDSVTFRKVSGSNLFDVDQYTGVVSRTSAAGSLSEASYVLTIEAMDDGLCCNPVVTLSSMATVTISINDINDNAPKFPDCDSYNPSVAEEQERGASVLEVTATDADPGINGVISFSLVESELKQGYFEIETLSSGVGLLRTRRRLDREQDKTFSLTILAEDSAEYGLTGFCQISVTVDDVNDEIPILSPTSVTIQDTLSVGSEVIKIEAYDPDEEDQNGLIYTLRQTSSEFQLDTDGTLKVKSSLLNAERNIELTVTARDNNQEEIQDVTSTIDITLVDNQAGAPVFSPVDAVDVDESTPINTKVFTVNATTSDPLSTITYLLIVGTTPETNRPRSFQIPDPTVGAVHVFDDLDYEEVQSYELLIQATDDNSQLADYITVTVNIVDENDRTPQFDLSKYTVNLVEGDYTGQNKEVVTVHAEDTDTVLAYKTVTYAQDPAKDPQPLFEVNPTTGEITTNGNFDREAIDGYTLFIIAEDGAPTAIPPKNGEPNRATITLRVEIIDINDNNPYFDDVEYSANVIESAQIGTVVTRTTATDKDEDSELNYLIAGGKTYPGDMEYQNAVFEVDSDTGDVKVAAMLDFESIERYELDYVVTDGLNENSTRLIIYVQDANDNIPVFGQAVYTVKDLKEEDDNEIGVILQVTATDADAQSGTITYSLEYENNAYFSIDRLSGEIRLLQALDYEYKAEWHFLAVAEDEGGSKGAADVVIEVGDINDNPPEFNEAEYEGKIAEGTGIRYVMTVEASDADSPANSQNTYSLVDDSNTFTIEDNGDIFTRNVELDREIKDTYYVEVIAQDPDLPLSATATATIIVTDVNDNSPIFDPTSYDKSVPESLTPGDKVLEIFASDADEGVNAELDFVITSGNVDSKFEVIPNPVNKQNAVIYLKNELDFETNERYTLTIRACDPNTCATATTTIQVTDVNEPPVFDPAAYSADVTEGQTTFTITVTATDPELNAITYALDPVTNDMDWLSIDGSTGVITQVKAFDRENIPVHNFIVLAVDNGSPVATGSCTLRITVLDINDECPRLVEDYRPVVMENLNPPQLVETIVALDPDTDPNQTPYKFSIINGNENGGEYTVNEAFSLDEVSDTSAEIKTRQKLDREATKFYNMVIGTEDTSGNSCSSTVTIEVGDVNDNPHQAGQKSMFVYTYQGGTTTGVGSTPVGPVSAPDLDDLEDKTYKEVAPNDNDDWLYFDLDTDTGFILIKEGTPDGIYEMQILVSDDGTFPDQTSTVTVTVRDIPEEAVYNSGSLRISGESAEEFIKEPDSTYFVLRNTLAEILGADEDNVDIFSVINVDGETNVIDVRYSVHGSPYYKAERLDMAVRQNKEKVEAAIGLDLVMIKIDACFLDESVCEGSCYNNFTVTKEPYLIDLESQSFTGITTYTTAACGCAGTDVFPDGCSYDACMNGGTCVSTIDGFRCECPNEYGGGRCEKTKRSFKAGESYAWVESLEQCEDTVTSIDFITGDLTAVLFYNGPMQTVSGQPDDFIVLELVRGRPRLRLNLGDGTDTISFKDEDLSALNDDIWHTVEIRRNAQYVEMIVDHCSTATVTNDDIDSTNCKVTSTITGTSTLLNVNTPLQIGGVDQNSGWKYPITFVASGFDGCIRNLIQDGKLYDLSNNNVGLSSLNSEEGCPRTDDSCIENGEGNSWCINGICNANTNDPDGECICFPGYTGEKCDTETTPSDFALNSYVDYSVKAAAGLDTSGYEEHYHSVVRTWEETGLVWYIANLDTGEHTTIELVDGTMRLRYNLGDGEFTMSLPNYRVNNGQWHSVEYDRYGNFVTLKVDRGGGTRQVQGAPGSFQIFVATAESLRVGDSAGSGFSQQDFQGCMNDPRINNNFLGFTDSDYATVTASNNVTEGCISEACNGVTCPAPKSVCNDLWRRYECICPINTIGDLCIPISCDPNPCLNGGKCVEDDGSFKCICTEDYVGDTCGIGKTATTPGGVSAALIAIICTCLLFLLIVLIILLLYKNKNRQRGKAMLDLEDDDLVEDLAYYDEEGGGELDHDGYDINTLTKPVGRLSDGSLEKDRLMPESAVPVGNAYNDAPREVADLLDERIPKCDDDPDNSPFDSLHVYDYEGEGSTAGSLSSINSASTDGSQDFDYLNSLGKPFKRLADMYGGGED